MSLSLLKMARGYARGIPIGAPGYIAIDEG